MTKIQSIFVSQKFIFMLNKYAMSQSNIGNSILLKFEFDGLCKRSCYTYRRATHYGFWYWNSVQRATLQKYRIYLR